MKRAEPSSLERIDSIKADLSDLQNNLLNHGARVNVQQAIAALTIAQINEREHLWYMERVAPEITRLDDIEADEAEH